MKQNDKAGATYWDGNWSKVEFPKALDENDPSLDNYVSLQLHDFFKNFLKEKKKFSVLEIGSANSIWPIYFHQYFKAEVHGLDYSQIGCEKSRALLEHYQVPGNIYCADLFDPPAELLHKFDVVVSFGVVEHFEDTAHCLKSCAAFVKPGGILFTLIPNMPSINGLIQKLVDRSVYDLHMPLTKEKFIDAYNQANLQLEYCDYFMFLNLSVVNLGSFSSNQFSKILLHCLSACSKFTWALEKIGLRLPRNMITSPYIIAVAHC